MTLSRRHFLERLAGTAGATMTYQAMTALGLLSVPPSAPGEFELRGHGGSMPILILGAGLAGLATAYELGKLGYDCRILEARRRPGGRCHTIRRGTPSEEAGSNEVAAFDEGLYYNPGPMRIPHHHHTTLGYCRELQVPVEVFVNDNEAAYLYQAKTPALAGKRLRSREVRADLSGYVAELLSKAVSMHALDEPLTDADQECLLEYLRRAGALNEKAAYAGSARRGYDTPPGAGDLPGGASTPLALDDLLGSKTGLYLQTEYLQQATMFQVVGGTDRLAAGFAARLSGRITYGAEVREIHQHADGVSVIYMKDSHAHRATAAYAVCAMPLVVLASLQGAHFAPDVKTAIASVPYSAAGKIGLQFKRRFWEEDDAIFGGISKTDQEIAQIVYPSSGFLGPKGILIGYYQNGANATAMARRTAQERLSLALSQGELIHPPYRKEFETAFSVSWQNVPWNLGGWAQYSPEARRTAYPVFLRPDGRFYFAGDHVSYMSGWMTGALESGRLVAASIHARAGRQLTRSAA
jgi:monoamine oxidase